MSPLFFALQNGALGIQVAVEGVVLSEFFGETGLELVDVGLEDVFEVQIEFAQQDGDVPHEVADLFLDVDDIEFLAVEDFPLEGIEQFARLGADAHRGVEEVEVVAFVNEAALAGAEVFLHLHIAAVCSKMRARSKFR